MMFPVDIWYGTRTRSSLLSIWGLSLLGPVCKETGLAELNAGHDDNEELNEFNSPAEPDGGGCDGEGGNGKEHWPAELDDNNGGGRGEGDAVCSDNLCSGRGMLTPSFFARVCSALTRWALISASSRLLFSSTTAFGLVSLTLWPAPSKSDLPGTGVAAFCTITLSK